MIKLTKSENKPYQSDEKFTILVDSSSFMAAGNTSFILYMVIFKGNIFDKNVPVSVIFPSAMLNICFCI